MTKTRAITKFDEALGAAVRSAREEAGLTQEQLAAKIKTDSGNLSRWESGQYGMRASTMAKIAAALGITILDLLDRLPSQYPR